MTTFAVAVRPRFALGISVLVASGLVFASPALAADNAEPDYQVKLLLSGEQVIDPATGHLTADAAAELNAGSLASVETVQYVDDEAQALDDAGWSIRIRRDHGDDELQLTYKARFNIEGPMTERASIDDALDRANDANLDASDTNYEPQVNLSYRAATLDFSNKKDEPYSKGESGSLPGQAESADVLIDNLPGKMEDLGDSSDWASDVIRDGKIYGPLTQEVYPVSVAGIDAEIEITEMRGAPDSSGYYVEITTKSEKYEDALDARETLLDELTDDGYLLPEDAFKTDLVLAHY